MSNNWEWHHRAQGIWSTHFCPFSSSFTMYTYDGCHEHVNTQVIDYIPSPISISSSSSWNEDLDPGTLQGERLTPIVPDKHRGHITSINTSSTQQHLQYSPHLHCQLLVLQFLWPPPNCILFPPKLQQSKDKCTYQFNNLQIDSRNATSTHEVWVYSRIEWHNYQVI